MNIFYVDHNPIKAAQQLPDKHVTKMPVETVQMLVSALIRYGVDHDVRTKAGTVHRGGYHNHPCTVWCGDTRNNFAWLLAHGYGLCDEYQLRYGREHACKAQLDQVARYVSLIPAGEFTPPALAMPDELKVSDSVESYHNCIRNKVALKPLSFVWNKYPEHRPAWV